MDRKELLCLELTACLQRAVPGNVLCEGTTRFHDSRGIVDGRLFAGDFFLGASGEYAFGVLLGVPAGMGGGVFFLDQKPLVALASHLDSF